MENNTSSNHKQADHSLKVHKDMDWTYISEIQYELGEYAFLMPNVCNFRKFSYFRVFYYIIFFLLHEELASLVFGMDHSLDLHQDCEIYDLFGE
ncbi:hypothetical protein NC652_031040 [Populus alba x Populus x berolinensis]|nr:hypothetical protein NC652_031040 [Populus alba x Populus x berolinensis]